MTDPVDPLALARACAGKMYTADRASRELGIAIEIPEAGRSVAKMAVRADMINGHAVCHGGYIFTLADTAVAFASNSYNQVTLAASGTIEFLAPARVGDRLVAHAVQRHRGRRSGTYDVRVMNQDDELVALFRGRSVSTDQPLIDPT